MRLLRSGALPQIDNDRSLKRERVCGMAKRVHTPLIECIHRLDILAVEESVEKSECECGNGFNGTNSEDDNQKKDYRSQKGSLI